MIFQFTHVCTVPNMIQTRKLWEQRKLEIGVIIKSETPVSEMTETNHV